MGTNNQDATAPPNEATVIHGSGSVAHQIIGDFLSTLERSEGYEEIAEHLKTVIFDAKPTEATLRVAMFGESPL
jgi:hypothetical protein